MAKKKMLVGLVAAVAVVLALGIGLRVWLDRDAELQLRAGERIYFKARNSEGLQNVHARCPPDYCDPPADGESPRYPVPPERLESLVGDVMLGLDAVRVEERSGGRRQVWIARTRLLRFPDIVTIEIVPVEGGGSTLAIDSRSRYGKSDLGANRARIERILAALQAKAGG